VLNEELARLPGPNDEPASAQGDGGPPYYRASLPSGREAVVLALTLPNQQAPLATLAVALPPGQSTPAVDPDILASFADRIALAIENASLYRTLAHRGDDLQRAYADLASAHQELLSVDEMKTNFLANVSHELRTPLTSIRSFSELLLSYDDPAVRQEFLNIIKVESERLTRLVNDVLDITKIESGFMEWRMAPVDLAALLRESARLFEPAMKNGDLTFEQAISPDLPPVHADADRLQQVIANLLHNAMKFTPRGVISLRAWWTGEEVRIAVADTGMGVAPEDQERIFEKFQQVGAMLTDKPSGTGLGLAICRDIIIHHHGRLWLQSQPDQGSTFTIALPAADDAGATVAALAVA
jgi:signal transduction histidine kinase